MKIILKISFIISILSITLNAIAQKEEIQEKYEKMMIGTWKVDSLELKLANLAPEYQEFAREKTKQIIPTIEISISEDHKYSMKGMPGVKNGIWGISKDGKLLNVKPIDNKPIEKSKIISLTEDKMIIQPLNPNSGNSKAYLYKVK
ncbi:MAG: hypothetical protein LBV69_10375 [Bacteroidales bacterium]|jgi:hypothetical protein|nr:hypothetical protein [Bacteroidales bacterium]